MKGKSSGAVDFLVDYIELLIFWPFILAFLVLGLIVMYWWLALILSVITVTVCLCVYFTRKKKVTEIVNACKSYKVETDIQTAKANRDRLIGKKIGKEEIIAGDRMGIMMEFEYTSIKFPLNFVDYENLISYNVVQDRKAVFLYIKNKYRAPIQLYLAYKYVDTVREFCKDLNSIGCPYENFAVEETD